MKELRSNSTMNNRTWNVRKPSIASAATDSEGVELNTIGKKLIFFRINSKNEQRSTNFKWGCLWCNRFTMNEVLNGFKIEVKRQETVPSRFTKFSKFSKFATPHNLLTAASYFLFIVLFFSHCANPIPPTGGDRDTTPPRLIIEESTPNLQTNFTKQPIELTFNEWIVLKDKIKNILVSPPLEKGNLNVEIKRRTVVVNFPEEETLKPDATYVINFGEAVQDLTENNPAEDLRFVFSTGDVIDSLEVNGNVVDAFTGEPVAETTVMLYRNLADSVVYTQRPFYFSKTDEAGTFTISNIKAGTYKIAAVVDDFQDYQFSNGELIGFLSENIEVTDSTTEQINLRLFQPVQSLRLQKTLDRDYGKVGLQFNQLPNVDSLNLDFSIENLTTFTEIEKDTLRIWCDLADSTRWEIYVSYPNNSSVDTAKVRAHSRTEFLNESSLQAVTRTGNAPKNLNPTKPIRFAFNHPLVQIDTNFIQLQEDSVRNVTANYQLDTATAQRELIIEYPWKDSSLYQLIFFPNALTDLYGFGNDTLSQSYQTLSAADFGTIDFKITELDSTQQYVVRLFFKKTNLIDTYIINNTSEWEQSITALPAGEYNIELIFDENRNGKWDVGDYDTQQLPEVVKFKTLEELRANWNLEVPFTPAEL